MKKEKIDVREFSDIEYSLSVMDTVLLDSGEN